ncbi:hypothetical protein MVEN_01040900 [Mycena venus]|uniref:Wings apart-like protein C-terminal domain-containing protein n=1 Tax=Mycena venus TaxID=2733690 RepID=A0A8H7D2W5_9AGAR|nr:hypothetical protein MVEN_01040900 [Mycena venus]
MPSTSFNSRTYSRKSVKRKSESATKSTPDAKRTKFDQDPEQEDSTDVEDSPPPRPRPPRDLSQIFEAVTSAPLSPEKSPGKLAKRMLSRSRTESSIASGSASGGGSKHSSISSIISRTPSLPSPFQPPSPPKPPNPEAKQSPVPRPKMSGTNLQDELDDEFASRESYTSLRTRWGVDESEDDPYLYGSPTRSGSNLSTPNRSPSKGGKGRGKARPEPVPLANGMMNPLKSITELRNQGESRRFLDEVGYLWEGLDKSGGLGLRRASALEITTKLCESEFARKAKAADFIGPTWDLLRTAGGGPGEDRASPPRSSVYLTLTIQQIMDILLAFFAALVSRDPASLSDLAARSSLTSTLFSLLETSSPSTDPLTCISDAAQLRKLGFSKKDQNLLTTIHTAISNSSLFPDSTKLSISLLTSHTLTSLPSSILTPTPTNMKALLSTLRSHLSPLLASPMSTFLTTSLYTDPHIAFLHIHNALSLLDTYLLAGWAPQLEDDVPVNQQDLEDARDTWLSEGLIALGIYMEAVNTGRKGAKERDSDKTQECALVTLRLLVGLTHSDKVWCAKLTKSESCFGFILRAILRGHSARLGKAVKEEPEGNGKVKREEGAVPAATENGNGLAHGKQNGKRPVKVEKDSDDESDDTGTTEKTDGAEGGARYVVSFSRPPDKFGSSGRRGQEYPPRHLCTCPPHCTLPRCLTACKCPQQITAFEALARVYQQLLPVPTPLLPNVKLEPPPEPTPADPSVLLAAEESQLLLSHLSLLFGLLMLDNAENQAVVLALPFRYPCRPPGTTGTAPRSTCSLDRRGSLRISTLGRRVAMLPRKGRA